MTDASSTPVAPVLSGVRQALLAGAIDYAGLFPPAQLGMADAVANYAAYRRSPDRWALGRFVVPIGMLAELEAAARPRLADDGWRLSAISGTELTADLARLRAWNAGLAKAAVRLRVDALELRASTEAAIASLPAATAGLETYVEIPIAEDPRSLVRAIARAGLRAKVRTGGVTPDAFPTPASLLRFLRACIGEGVPFKATAGLHHPLRDSYRLTYAPNSASAPMFGYLNVILTTVLLHDGATDDEAIALLTESSPRALRVVSDGVEWRGRTLALSRVREARASAVLAFGSCSFREPLDELAALPLV